MVLEILPSPLLRCLVWKSPSLERNIFLGHSAAADALSAGRGSIPRYPGPQDKDRLLTSAMRAAAGISNHSCFVPHGKSGSRYACPHALSLDGATSRYLQVVGTQPPEASQRCHWPLSETPKDNPDPGLAVGLSHTDPVVHCTFTRRGTLVHCTFTRRGTLDPCCCILHGQQAAVKFPQFLNRSTGNMFLIAHHPPCDPCHPRVSNM